MKTLYVLVGLVLFTYLSACSTLSKLNPWGGDESAEESTTAKDAEVAAEGGDAKTDQTASAAEPTAEGKVVDDKVVGPVVGSKRSVKNLTIEELELKQARLWARVDALEDQANRHKERMRVIEKGLMLGLVPEELKEDVKRKPAVSKASAEAQQPKHAAPAKVAAKAVVPEPKPASAEDNAAFEARMVAAQDFFRGGRYGRAIAEYSAVGKEFKHLDKNGSHQFWIALSWMNLKELQTAQQNFENFLQEYSSSTLATRAHFYLARVEAQLGMRDKSLQRLRRIINEFPNEDAAEMAKMEITNMGKAL